MCFACCVGVYYWLQRCSSGHGMVVLKVACPNSFSPFYEGVYEALELRDGGSDYLGKGVLKVLVLYSFALTFLEVLFLLFGEMTDFHYKYRLISVAYTVLFCHTS